MIEPLMMSTSLIASTITPIGLMRRFRWGKVTALLVSLLIANFLTHFVFWIFNPTFRYGPLHGLAIVMYLSISIAISAPIVFLMRTKP